MDDTTVWKISPHTAAKHSILKRYVQAWAPILASGSNHKRFIYIDGFSGPGQYADGEDGSPVVVLKSLKDHQLKENFKNAEFVNIFIEKNKERAELLQKVLKEKVAPLPDWIKFDVINAEFNTEMQKILDKLQTEEKNLAPCLCFVDPFGWSALDYDVLSSIMKYEKAELLITFMAGYLERFVWEPLHLSSIRQLYSEEQILSIKRSDNNENLVTKYFLDNLTNSIRNKGIKTELFSLSFATYNNNNRLEYYLIYLTKHCKGFEVMKNAMFNSAKDGSYRFSDFDFDPNQKTLIDYGQEKIWVNQASSDSYDVLVSKFGKGKKIDISMVKSTINCQTKWIFRNDILAKLEELNKIEVIVDKRRKGTYPARGFIVLK